MDGVQFGILIVALLLMFGGIVIWFMKLEGRLNSHMTFQQHQDICDRTDKRVSKSIDELRNTMEKFEAAAATAGAAMAASINTLSTRVEVLASQARTRERHN